MHFQLVQHLAGAHLASRREACERLLARLREFVAAAIDGAVVWHEFGEREERLGVAGPDRLDLPHVDERFAGLVQFARRQLRQAIDRPPPVGQQRQPAGLAQRLQHPFGRVDQRRLFVEVALDQFAVEARLVAAILLKHLAEHLRVQLAQQRRAVFHQHDVAQPREDDAVRQWRRHRRVGAVAHRPLAAGDVGQHLARVLEVERVVEHLAVRLLEHGEAREFMDGLEHLRGAQLLSRQRNLVPLVVAQHHERAVGAMAKALREKLRVADGASQRRLERLRVERLADALQLDEVGERQQERVVVERDAHRRAEVAPELVRERPRQRVVDASSEREMEHRRAPAAVVDVPLDQQLPVGRHEAAELLLLAQVRQDGARRAGVEPEFLLEPRLRLALRLAQPLIDGGAEAADRLR